MSQRKALITGVLGQDGAYLARFLLDQGYQLHGLQRWDSDVSADARYDRFAALGVSRADIQLHMGDILDSHGMLSLVEAIQPDEVYNLAAISHVAESFSSPSVCMDIITKGTLNLLEALRRGAPQARYYQASSSEMFGSAPAPQDELSPMLPCSPYGAAKLSAYHLTRIYRESYGLFAANGILFNHESPQRAHDFVTQKIVQAVAAIKNSQQDCLYLGNLEAERDWGHAADYVRGMHMMLQAGAPDDFVLSTGQSHSVRSFVEGAFAAADIALTWQGRDLDEVGVDPDGRVLVWIDPQFFRPMEVTHLQGNAVKAREKLGWQPHYGFDDLVADMMRGALARYE